MTHLTKTRSMETAAMKGYDDLVRNLDHKATITIVSVMELKGARMKVAGDISIRARNVHLFAVVRNLTLTQSTFHTS